MDARGEATSADVPSFQSAWPSPLRIRDRRCRQCALAFGETSLHLPRFAQVGFRGWMEDLELGRGTPVKVGGRAPVRSPFAAGGPLCENHIHIAVACQRSCKI